MTKKQLLSPTYRSIYLIDSRNSICQFFLLQLFLMSGASFTEKFCEKFTLCSQQRTLFFMLSTYTLDSYYLKKVL